MIVIFPAERIAFGTVAAGGTTEYRPAPAGVFRYAAYSFVVDGVRVTQPVTDWVGEKPMEGEAFTCIIEFDPSQPVPQRIRLVEAIRD